MALALLALAAACGGDSFSLPTPGPGGETIIRIEMRDNLFSPNNITIRANQKYIFELRNRGDAPHNLRIAGPDLEFDTDDDIASELIDGGKTGTFALEMTTAGTFPFRCDPHAVEMEGTLTVWAKPTIPSPTASPTPSPTPTPIPSPTPTPEVTLTPEGTATAEVPPVSTIPPAGP
jgi:plastocyanin